MASRHGTFENSAADHSLLPLHGVMIQFDRYTGTEAGLCRWFNILSFLLNTQLHRRGSRGNA